MCYANSVSKVSISRILPDQWSDTSSLRSASSNNRPDTWFKRPATCHESRDIQSKKKFRSNHIWKTRKLRIKCVYVSPIVFAIPGPLPNPGISGLGFCNPWILDPGIDPGIENQVNQPMATNFGIPGLKPLSPICNLFIYRFGPNTYEY